jgi:hypothetical protein
MPGKRTQTASSSPNYERVVWVEKKTARGAKITAKVANSPQTPKARKWEAPHYKKRHVIAFSTLSFNLLFEPISFFYFSSFELVTLTVTHSSCVFLFPLWLSLFS